MYGLELFVPEQKGAAVRARQILKGGDKHVPARSPPPVSKDIVQAMGAYFAEEDQSHMALALVLPIMGTCGLRN